MRRRSFYHQTEWRVLAGLTAIAVALIISHERARAATRLSAPERGARWVLAPVQQAFTVAWRETALTAGGLARSRSLERENQMLRRKNAELEFKVIQRQYESLDYQDIVEAFGFEPPASPDEIPAFVVGRSGGRFVRQTIDIVAGARREIRKGDIVLHAGRLVGRVHSAQGSRARVTLLLDPDSGAAAVVKPSDSKGSIMGPDPASPYPGLLRLRRLERDAHIAIGNKVYTSRIGETYPPGILIGVVEEVVGGSGPAEPKTALVKPFVDFGDLDYVMVIRPSD